MLGNNVQGLLQVNKVPFGAKSIKAFVWVWLGVLVGVVVDVCERVAEKLGVPEELMVSVPVCEGVKVMVPVTVPEAVSVTLTVLLPEGVSVIVIE